MAEKRPLCLYGGRIEELRVIDTLPGGGGTVTHARVTLAQNASYTMSHANDPDHTRLISLVNHVTLTGGNVIPVMTGPSTAGCTITANPDISSYNGWKVADSNEGDTSAWAFPSAPGWLQIALPQVETIISYSIKSRDYSDIGPKEFSLSASTDGGTTWMEIDHRIEASWPSSTTKTYILNAPVTAAMFRLDVLQAFGSSYTYNIGITSLKLIPPDQVSYRIASPSDYLVEMLDAATRITRQAAGSMTVDFTVRI